MDNAPGRTLQSGLRPARAVWLGLAIVLAARLAVGLAGVRTRVFRGPSRDPAFLNMELKVIGDHLRPRMLLMGSSRTRYGLHEADVAAAQLSISRTRCTRASTSMKGVSD